MSVRKGDKATLVCETSGDAPLEIFWKRNGILISENEDARSVITFVAIIDFLLATSPMGCLYLHTCVLPVTPTDAMARIFFPNSYLRQGMELTLALLHLFEEP